MKKTSALIILATLSLLPACHKKGEGKKPPLPSVITTYPVKKTVPVYIDAPGHIYPIQTVNIEPQVDGEVVEILYEEGTFVQEGELLIKIDDRPFLANRSKAEAELAQNQAELSYARDTLARNEPLAMDDYISKDRLDKLFSNMETLEGSIMKSLADIESAQINVDYCSIRAPISGLLGSRLVDKGNIVTAYSGNKLVTIKQISPIWSEFAIDEKHLYEVQQERAHRNLEVHIYQEKPSQVVARGELVFVDNHVNRKTGQVLLKGNFENQNQLLWPGQYVQVRLIVKELDNALLIPSICVQQGQKGDYVFVVGKDNIIKKVSVKAGQRHDDGASIVILDGLSMGDQIVQAGQINIYSGAKVQVKSGGEKRS